ncbi:hypothetical protein MXAN_0509 [Myxococcus xanthus DK 1622]|uniref:Uncharacterized protein n=1 Tax=Myxococcus xanthus (strain DK1622) TaxID=246197 RepID=Q1DEZ5_MYXXD|nr:hypothetical protein MXAN_0509 [Myxococcus xanthus DK 1622]
MGTCPTTGLAPRRVDAVLQQGHALELEGRGALAHREVARAVGLVLDRLTLALGGVGQRDGRREDGRLEAKSRRRTELVDSAVGAKEEAIRAWVDRRRGRGREVGVSVQRQLDRVDVDQRGLHARRQRLGELVHAALPRAPVLGDDVDVPGGGVHHQRLRVLRAVRIDEREGLGDEPPRGLAVGEIRLGHAVDRERRGAATRREVGAPLPDVTDEDARAARAGPGCEVLPVGRRHVGHVERADRARVERVDRDDRGGVLVVHVERVADHAARGQARGLHDFRRGHGALEREGARVRVAGHAGGGVGGAQDDHVRGVGLHERGAAGEARLEPRRGERPVGRIEEQSVGVTQARVEGLGEAERRLDAGGRAGGVRPDLCAVPDGEATRAAGHHVGHGERRGVAVLLACVHVDWLDRIDAAEGLHAPRHVGGRVQFERVARRLGGARDAVEDPGADGPGALLRAQERPAGGRRDGRGDVVAHGHPRDERVVGLGPRRLGDRQRSDRQAAVVRAPTQRDPRGRRDLGAAKGDDLRDVGLGERRAPVERSLEAGTGEGHEGGVEDEALGRGHQAGVVGLGEAHGGLDRRGRTRGAGPRLRAEPDGSPARGRGAQLRRSEGRRAAVALAGVRVDRVGRIDAGIRHEVADEVARDGALESVARGLAGGGDADEDPAADAPGAHVGAHQRPTCRRGDLGADLVPVRKVRQQHVTGGDARRGREGQAGDRLAARVRGADEGDLPGRRRLEGTQHHRVRDVGVGERGAAGEGGLGTCGPELRGGGAVQHAARRRDEAGVELLGEARRRGVDRGARGASPDLGREPHCEAVRGRRGGDGQREARAVAILLAHVHVDRLERIRARHRDQGGRHGAGEVEGEGVTARLGRAGHAEEEPGLDGRGALLGAQQRPASGWGGDGGDGLAIAQLHHQHISGGRTDGGGDGEGGDGQTARAGGSSHGERGDALGRRRILYVVGLRELRRSTGGHQ